MSEQRYDIEERTVRMMLSDVIERYLDKSAEAKRDDQAQDEAVEQTMIWLKYVAYNGEEARDE